MSNGSHTADYRSLITNSDKIQNPEPKIKDIYNSIVGAKWYMVK